MIGDPICIYRRFLGSFLPDWLACRTEVSFGAKVCYAQLAAFAGKKDHCWPLLRTLSESMGVTDRQATRYLTELVECFLIKVDYRKAEGRSSVYTLLEHEWMPPPEERREGDTSGQVRQEGSRQKRQEGQTHLSGGADTFVRTRNRLKEVDSSKGPKGLSPTAPNEPPPLSDPGPADGEEKENPAESPTLPQQAHKLSLGDMQLVVEGAVARSESVEAARARQRARAEAKLHEPAEEAPQRGGRGGANGKSKRHPKYSPEVVDALVVLERRWRDAIRERWPDTEFATWGQKERGQCAELLKRCSGAVVEQALLYVIGEWAGINKRFFKGTASFPAVGTLLRFSDVLIPEAQRWGEMAKVQREYDQWFVEHPNDLVVPEELKLKYEKARQGMEALGH